MACEAIQLWTFNGLAAAYLDLGIAYLLLYASSLVFFTSKFLALFGLCLPCPCDGLFGNLSSDHCFQKLLVDRSSKKISSVLHSARDKFPFNSMWDQEPKCCFKSRRNVKEAHVELEGEAPCSCFSETRSQGMIYGDFPGKKETDADEGLTFSKEEAKLYITGNGVSCQRPGNSLHHLKGGVGLRTFMSVSPNDILQLNMEDVSQSPSSFSGFGDNNTEGSFFSVDSGDGGEASSDNNGQDRVFPDLELDDSHNEKTCPEMDESFAEEAGNNCRGELCLDGDEIDTIKLLERALEKEQTARSTLYLELEKERSAAASAADEAMAMILRLQEEKASIEMDARQYQRMIEEKTVYDAEEMSILKEILVRREREMHFLEKEVEAYRKSFYGDDEVDDDMPGLEATPQWTPPSPYSTEDPSHMLQWTPPLPCSTEDPSHILQWTPPLPYSTEDPSHMLQCINRSGNDKQDANYAKSSSQHEIPSIESRNLTFEFGAESPFIQVDELADATKAGSMSLHQVTGFFKDSEEANNDLQEKGIVEDEITYTLQGEGNKLEPFLHSNESNGLGMDEKSIVSIADEHKRVNEASCDDGSALEKNSDYQNQQTRNLNPVNDTDPYPHDIHVIDDEASMCSEVSANASKEPEATGTSSIPVKCDSPSFSLLESQLDITRSSSDATGRFPLMARSRSNCLRSDLRRNSMSAVDYERSKIGNEVEWLRERLKVVQEGREKLKFAAVELKENENNQLQLLENITNHLREVRQLTDPGKATLQAPLPPSFKAVPKKRCWRSSSLSIHRSS